ncbi:MAG: hypothetical protein GX047_04660 [Firmicutes bacterium]|nr:hypothetical protein [Bacillota bacterium]
MTEKHLYYYPEFGPEDLNKLERLLQRFAEYRSDEERYLENERTYKVNLFNYLAGIWVGLESNPDESRQLLLRFMRKDGVDGALIWAFDNLLGGWGYAPRHDFAVYLQSLTGDEFRQLMDELFHGDGLASERLVRFRDTVNAAYEALSYEGNFHQGKKTVPKIPWNFVAALLASYDPKSYILYRFTTYRDTAQWLGLEVPSTPEQCYAHLLDLAKYILEYAQERDYPVHDLIDVHNMMYMLWSYDEFRSLRTDTGLTARESLYSYIRNEGFIFPDWLVTDYVLSLATKPFVILSGMSGTGKTKLAQLFADYLWRITGGQAGKAFVSVRPDWIDNSHLLGWYNAIAERYERTPVLELLLDASDVPDVPHFIILDEMNIAKVEHYFSDFLSCMESRRIGADGKTKQEPIRLHSYESELEDGEGPGVELGVPAKLHLPWNVYVTGTVNVDESTYMFSPKVLDRANVIELNEVYLDGRVEEDLAQGFVLKPDVALLELFAEYKPPTMESLNRMKASMPEQFDAMLGVHETLKQYHLHFGYRVANEMAEFMLKAQQYCEGGDGILPLAFDLQVMQKILPKLHGNVGQLSEPIDALLGVLPGYCTRSIAKLMRMQKRLGQVGFTSFIE